MFTECASFKSVIIISSSFAIWL